jgi:hypothetical protein
LTDLDSIFTTADYDPYENWVVVGIYDKEPFVVAVCSTEARANEISAAVENEGEVTHLRVIYSDAVVI